MPSSAAARLAMTGELCPRTTRATGGGVGTLTGAPVVVDAVAGRLGTGLATCELAAATGTSSTACTGTWTTTGAGSDALAASVEVAVVATDCCSVVGESFVF